MNKRIETSPVSTTGTVSVSSMATATSTHLVGIPVGGRRQRGRAAAKSNEQNIEKAVYGYIRAIRAVGRAKVDSGEISVALNLPFRDVEKAMRQLSGRGVKIVR